MAFTQEAIRKDASLIPDGADRAWEVWDEPPETVPDTVVAFRLLFPSSELGVRPEQREGKLWSNTLWIEPAPEDSGRLTAVTVFVTGGDPSLSHESEPSVTIASLELGNDRRAQLVAHAEPLGTIPEMIARARREALSAAREAGIEVPADGYLYFFGSHPDDARFIVGARASET